MDNLHQKYRQRLSQRCEQRSLVLSPLQLDRLTAYAELLLHWRRYINLTGLRQAEDIIDILIGESLDFLQPDLLPDAARVLDLGTGAGVPGVPLAICAPALHLTLLDRSQKKVTFLQHILPRLHLHNCQPVCSTAEDVARRLSASQRFDVVVTRGVGRVAHLLRLAAPLLQPGGQLLLRKPHSTPELQEAASLLTSTGWEEVKILPLPQRGPLPWVLLVIFRRPEDSPG
ncbi:MAG TPA: 16S rRNA (guanine(527)-N(7))-methyltransferase RsmG [Candidatus Tectomicrobia bacterium]